MIVPSCIIDRHIFHNISAVVMGLILSTSGGIPCGARLRNNGVKVGFKLLNVLCMCFWSPNDKPSTLQSRGVVYKVRCDDCTFMYYRQTYIS